MTDSHAWLHGKKFALYGDPDFVLGMAKFLLELGAEPTHIVWPQRQQELGQGDGEAARLARSAPTARSMPGNDLWHMRSLCFTDKPDFLIGNTYGKYIQRDTLAQGRGVRGAADPHRLPDLRPPPPASPDHAGLRRRHVRCVTTLTNAVLERLDEETQRHGYDRLQLRPGSLIRITGGARENSCALPVQQEQLHGQHHDPAGRKGRAGVLPAQARSRGHHRVRWSSTPRKNGAAKSS